MHTHSYTNMTGRARARLRFPLQSFAIDMRTGQSLVGGLMMPKHHKNTHHSLSHSPKRPGDQQRGGAVHPQEVSRMHSAGHTLRAEMK